MDQKKAAWTHASSIAAIRRKFRQPKIAHERIRSTYGEMGQHLDFHREAGMTRAEQVTLSRLRSGHHPDLKSWLSPQGQAEDTDCRKCGTGPETPQHILTECPRLRNYRDPSWTMADATRSPRKSLDLWNRWKTLEDLQEQQKETTSTEPKAAKDPCGVCTKNVGKNGWSVKCAQCLLWVHQRCSGLTRRQLSALPKDHDWRCPHC